MSQHVKQILELYKQGKVKESTLVKMAAFKEELLKTGMNNGVKDFLKYLAMYLGVGTGIGLIGATAHKLTDMYEAHKIEENKKPKFDEMLKLHPELKENQNQAWQYYEALWHFSPSIADNPLAAGAYIKQALQMHDVAGGPLPDLVQRLVDIEQKKRDAENKRRTPSGTATSGFTALPTSFQAPQLFTND
jgi:hypothetical protein